jgi:hypothetical protein
VPPRNVFVGLNALKHDTFKPAFPVIWEDIAVLFQKDVPLVQ